MTVARGTVRTMRSANGVNAVQHAAALVGDDAGLWRASCHRAGDVITVRRPAGPPPSEMWMEPHLQVLVEATALLVYGLARHQHAKPATLSPQDLLGWLDRYGPAQDSPPRWRTALAAMLHTAGHETSRPGRAGDDADPVIAAWQKTLQEDDHVPTIDGTYGLFLEDGLAGLGVLLRPAAGRAA